VSAARKRLAFVGPLPPVRSGIADYARDLLPYIARDFEVEVFVDGRHPLVAQGAYSSLRLHSGEELGRLFAEFDWVVYQMGNNLHHRFVLELARELPGVVVLHDLVLHHLYEEIAGLEDQWERYGEALVEGYGPVGAAVVQWKRWRLASERENFALPLFEPIGARSRGVLVHSRSAEAQVRCRLPATPVERVPMGIPRGPQLDRDGARHRLGIPPEQVLVGAFGFLTPIKRLDVLAAALRAAWPRCPELRLVLVGEASPGLRLEKIFTPSELAGGRVEHRGYVAEDEYRDWMAATDVAVNLRFPSAGETSASLLRLLGDGKCTLVSAYRQFLEIPAAAAVRIPLGAEEEETLVRELVALARDPERRIRIGRAAQAFVAAEHSMEAAARGFSSAIQRIAPGRTSARPPRFPIWRPAATSRSASVHATILACDPRALRSRPGSAVEIRLWIRNDGASRWISTPQRFGGQVAIAADLLGAQGELSARLRPTAMVRDLLPGEEESVRLRFTAPRDCGGYLVQPTIVHFGRGGSRPAGDPIPLVVAAEAA
jgi:glycosyltransferase involved in cell wall biosynthesis